MSVCNKKFLRGLGNPTDLPATKSADFVCFRPKNRPQKFRKITFFWLFWDKFDIFFSKFFFSPQMTKNGFWGLFLFPKTVFMHFLTILSKFKFLIFDPLWRSKMHIFDHFGALLDFFFQNFVLPTNYQQTIKKCFFHSKIFQKFKILELSYMAQNCIKMIFGHKKSQQKCFLMVSGQFEGKNCFWKKKSKRAPKWSKYAFLTSKGGQKFKI